MKQQPWRCGRLSLAFWSCLAYFALLIAFALPPLVRGRGLPLYQPEEYVQGSYPLFWAVYVCLPLLARDIYLCRKEKVSFPSELKFGIGSILLASLAAYHFIFGWY